MSLLAERSCSHLGIVLIKELSTGTHVGCFEFNIAHFLYEVVTECWPSWLSISRYRQELHALKLISNIHFFYLFLWCLYSTFKIPRFPRGKDYEENCIFTITGSSNHTVFKENCILPITADLLFCWLLLLIMESRKLPEVVYGFYIYPNLCLKKFKRKAVL